MEKERAERERLAQAHDLATGVGTIDFLKYGGIGAIVGSAGIMALNAVCTWSPNHNPYVDGSVVRVQFSYALEMFLKQPPDFVQFPRHR